MMDLLDRMETLRRNLEEARNRYTESLTNSRIRHRTQEKRSAADREFRMSNRALDAASRAVDDMKEVIRAAWRNLLLQAAVEAGTDDLTRLPLNDTINAADLALFPEDHI